MKKAIAYINQFFAGIGGEDKADHQPEIREGAVGGAAAIQLALRDVEITHTIICGDNFMGSHREDAIAIICEMLEDKKFDAFFAGPAFRAGRYGVACGEISRVIQERFGVPAFSSMNDENPGVEMFRKEMVISPVARVLLPCVPMPVSWQTTPAGFSPVSLCIPHKKKLFRAW